MSTPSPSPVYVPGPIWPPDWSQFIPDAIGAIVTGAIIGFVLWRIESGATASRDRREAESHWRVRRWIIAGALKNSQVSRRPRGHRELVDGWRALLGAFDPMIARWADASPQNTELAMARGLLINIPLLIDAIEELDRSLNDSGERTMIFPWHPAAVHYTFLRFAYGEKEAEWALRWLPAEYGVDDEGRNRLAKSTSDPDWASSRLKYARAWYAGYLDHEVIAQIAADVMRVRTDVEGAAAGLGSMIVR
jgi:hypothetical protein